MNIDFIVGKLLKIASEIEKEAEENTYFMCLNCNHTATLSDINKKRKVAAEQMNIEIPNVTVNDIVKCAACGDKMLYIPTEDSERYYIEAKEKEEQKQEQEQEQEQDFEDVTDLDWISEEKEEKNKDKKKEEEEKNNKEERDKDKDEESNNIKKGVIEEIVDKKDIDKDKDKGIDNVKIPKKEPPKFESMPDKNACVIELKDMDDDFRRAIKKYMI